MQAVYPFVTFDHTQQIIIIAWDPNLDSASIKMHDESLRLAATVLREHLAADDGATDETREAVEVRWNDKGVVRSVRKTRAEVKRLLKARLPVGEPP